jgi:hypothetical protein
VMSKSVGRPGLVASSEREFWVLAMQMGRSARPAWVNCWRRVSAWGLRMTERAP